MRQSDQNKSISSVRIKELFVLSTRLADLSEEMLEDQGNYSDKFIAGLKKSQLEAKKGKLAQVNSLNDLR